MKKKILVFHYAKSYGGGDIYLLNLLPELAKHYDLVLATVYPEKISSKLSDNNVVIPTYRIPLKNPFRLFGSFSFWNILKRERIDLIFTQDIGLSLFARIFQVFNRRMKHILVIQANFRYYNYKLPLMKSIVAFFNRVSQRLVAKYVCLSEYLVEAMVREGICRRSIELIYNSVQICDTMVRVPGEKFRVGLVGRLSYEKGVDYFLEIVKRFSGRSDKFEFHVFGDGPMADLVLQAQEQYPGLIIYHGFVKDVFKQNDLDLVLMPSRNEGLPFTALECMACGIPVLAARAGGLPDLIQDGQNGLLCHIGDIDGFVGSIDRLAADEELVKRLVGSGKKWVHDKYSAKNMKEKYLRLFASVLGSIS